MKLMVRTAALFAAAILMVAIFATIRATAGSTYPSSSQQALKELRRSASLGAHWSDFGIGSSVRARIHTVKASGGESTEVQIKELTARSNEEVTISLFDGEHREDLLDQHYPLDIPGFAESNATRLADDSAMVAGKLRRAEVYKFTRTDKILYETRTIEWTFWLVPGVPEGEARRVTQETSTDPNNGDTDDVKLTDLDVPFVVGRKTLHCYCRDSEDKYIDGRVEHGRICYNSSVPGGVVKKDARITENGKETSRQDYVVVDYHVER